MKKIILLCMLLTNLAHAGQESHGGSLVLCADQAPVVLDYYHATLPVFGDVQPPLMPIEGLSTEQVIENFRTRLKGTALLLKLDEALAKIGNPLRWPLKNLKDVHDSNEPYNLPSNCKLVQGAIRQDRRVYLDTHFGRLLSPAQLGVLAVHEALYFLSNQQTSEKIRTLIRALIILDTPEEDVATAIRAIGQYVYPRDLLFRNYSAQMRGGSRLKFHSIEKNVNDQARGCGFVLDYKGLDYQKGLLTIKYFTDYYSNDPWAEICQNLPIMRFQCAKDGKSCELISGEVAGGWEKGCKLFIQHEGFGLQMQCTDSQREYNFYMN